MDILMCKIDVQEGTKFPDDNLVSFIDIAKGLEGDSPPPSPPECG